MRKLSEVLAVALEQYELECESYGHNVGNGPFMCSTVMEASVDGRISSAEFDYLYDHIQGWIDHRITLACHLRKGGLPDHRAARLQFYKDKLAELQAKGE